MSVPSRTAQLGLVACLLLGACKDDTAQIEKARAAEAAQRREAIEKLSPAARAKIGLARKVADVLPSVPRAGDDAKPPVTDPKLRLMELHDDDAANADVMLTSELPLFQRAILGSCRYNDATTTSGGWSDMVSTSIESALKRCARVRWFLVVRTAVKVAPKLVGGATYEGGAYAGDVVVFDLASDPPTVAGAFPIEVVLQKSVKVGASATKDRQEYELAEALRKELLQAIEKATTG
ncbi:MAG: hypothetical protein HYV09_02635 [Deltaproteobacteria bacterium]|nr:hypothetical protein [Deltaproteobacteria bacterium]